MRFSEGAALKRAKEPIPPNPLVVSINKEVVDYPYDQWTAKNYGWKRRYQMVFSTICWAMQLQRQITQMPLWLKISKKNWSKVGVKPKYILTNGVSI